MCENLDNTGITFTFKNNTFQTYNLSKYFIIDAENGIRGNRETEYVDPTLDSNELTNEYRAIRCALKSNKHMRHRKIKLISDANK